MFREAEKQFTSSLKNQKMVETYAYLAKVSFEFIVVTSLQKVYIRLDQPLTAIDRYREGLDHFRNDVTLLTGLARVYEVDAVSEVKEMKFFSN